MIIIFVIIIIVLMITNLAMFLQVRGWVDKLEDLEWQTGRLEHRMKQIIEYLRPYQEQKIVSTRNPTPTQNPEMEG